MLIEELRNEIELDRALAPAYALVEGLLAKRNNTILEINRMRRRLQQHAQRAGTAAAAEDRERLAEQGEALEARLQALQVELAAVNAEVKDRKAQIDRRYNPFWGKLFKCGDINSRFGQQVKDFACVYTSAVSNFAAYPDDMYFRSTREIMPHEIGMDGV
jgi:seryl-tRNA synthetase